MSLEQIKERVGHIELEAKRQIGSTTLIAVSKLQPDDRVIAVLEQGHLDYGENRVQEAIRKWPRLKANYPDVLIHLLGPLQSNKVRQAMELFDVIHSIDRYSLVKRIARIADDTGHCPKLFIQVNTGEEEQKSGVIPAETDALIKATRALGLPLEGLMCIPPISETPALHFGLLAQLAKRNGLHGLSMGMSGDFESAIRIGATHVRIGTAIFGERSKVT